RALLLRVVLLVVGPGHGCALGFVVRVGLLRADPRVAEYEEGRREQERGDHDGDGDGPEVHRARLLFWSALRRALRVEFFSPLTSSACSGAGRPVMGLCAPSPMAAALPNSPGRWPWSRWRAWSIAESWNVLRSIIARTSWLRRGRAGGGSGPRGCGTAPPVSARAASTRGAGGVWWTRPDRWPVRLP